MCPDCLQTCHQIKYDYTLNKEDEWNQNDILLQVVLKEFGYEKITQNPAYPPEALFGELGGLLGLFIGASVLTVIEFVDLLVMTVVKKMRSGNKVERKTVELENPNANNFDMVIFE